MNDGSIEKSSMDSGERCRAPRWRRCGVGACSSRSLRVRVKERGNDDDDDDNDNNSSDCEDDDDEMTHRAHLICIVQQIVFNKEARFDYSSD